MKRSRRIVALILVVTCLMASSTNAFALDKRLKLLFKTAGYGAAAGLVLGAASTAMGLGGFRNVLMGTSAGLYAGIALAAYIVLTPPERPAPRGMNPYAPRKPVGPEDPDTDEEEIQEMVPNRQQPGSSIELALPAEKLAADPELMARPASAAAAKAIWTPILVMQF